MSAPPLIVSPTPSPLITSLPSLDSIRESARLAYYRANPVKWVEEVLGESLWSKQREIMTALVDHHKVAVPSGFATGKSFVASRLAIHWIACHPPGEAFVVTTAATYSQVRAILWREMGRAFEKAKLPGRMNQTEWHMTMPNGREELVAYGRKPADMDTTGFQGLHSPFILVIIDEAAGVPTSIYEGAEALVVNEDSRILAIGNPEDANSEFCRICKPGSGWHTIRIPAFSTPNFTGEEGVPPKVAHQLISRHWVEHKRRKWGEDNPMWIAKVLAEFPEVNEFGLIPISWIREAQERTLPHDTPDAPVEMGIDVGGGGNKSVITLRRGGHSRVIRRDTDPDTMSVADNAALDIDVHKPTTAKIDMIGIGRGVVDRLKQLRKGAAVGVNVSLPALDDTQFVNLRAEGYWHLRTLFQDGLIDIDPDDDDLAAQLSSIRYKRGSGGRIAIESKDEIRARGGVSPDEADSLMLAHLNPNRPKTKTKGTWGRRSATRARKSGETGGDRVPRSPIKRLNMAVPSPLTTPLMTQNEAQIDLNRAVNRPNEAVNGPNQPLTAIKHPLSGDNRSVNAQNSPQSADQASTGTTPAPLLRSHASTLTAAFNEVDDTPTPSVPRPILHSTRPAASSGGFGETVHGGELVSLTPIHDDLRGTPRSVYRRYIKPNFYLSTDNTPTSHPDGTPEDIRSVGREEMRLKRGEAVIDGTMAVEVDNDDEGSSSV